MGYKTNIIDTKGEKLSLQDEINIKLGNKGVRINDVLKNSDTLTIEVSKVAIVEVDNGVDEVYDSCVLIHDGTIFTTSSKPFINSIKGIYDALEEYSEPFKVVTVECYKEQGNNQQPMFLARYVSHE